jgi:pimeloyl-ACP methyl ester carboxylesterase
MIFLPQKTTDTRWDEIIQTQKVDYMSIRADDGAVLEGMLLHDFSEEPRPTVIFFGGNSMHVEQFVHHFLRLRSHGVNVLLMDYRGYGLSTGKPDAYWMKRDAEKIFDAANAHPYVDASQITAWGYSLGTGIAAHLAAKKPIAKVILYSSFTSMADLAQEQYPFVPVRLLLKHNFETLTLARTLKQPALIVQGEDDKQIAPDHATKIADAWAGEKELMIVPERGHNDLLEDEGVWERVIEFLQ